MKQRILLPAIIIGGLFAVALGFVRGLLPDATDAVRFAVDAAFLIGAVLVYGGLMREATAVAVQAAPAAEGRKNGRGRNDSKADRGRGGRNGKRGSERGSERGSDRGEQRGRGGRGGDGGRGGKGRGGARDEGREKKADREERPAAPAGPREDGEIKWFSGAKGYGFIIRPNGDEIFVHHRALRDKSRREIPDGTPVSYVVVDRDKGPQADDVDVSGAHSMENAEENAA